MNRSIRCTRARLLVIPAVLLLISLSVVTAAEETAVIEGVVTDKEGVPLPGVEVKVSGPALSGERFVVTDSEGRYRVENLPATDSYLVDFILDSFLRVIQTLDSLTVNEPNIVNITLIHATNYPENTLFKPPCYYPPPLIPWHSSTITEVFTWRFLDTLPNGRSWLDPVSMTAGVAGLEEPNRRGSTAFHVHGADATDNVYLVDGVETTNVASGRTGMAIPWEAVEDVEVITGGLPAEYGRAVGGVVNVVTRTGSNCFSGSIPFYYTDDGLQRSQDEDGGIIARDDFREIEWGGSLGGPIVRDHLWFFAAYNKFTHTIKGVNPQNEEIKRDYDFQEGLGNLVWQVNNTNKLSVQYAHSPAEWEYDDSPSEDVPALLEAGDRLWDLKWTSILHPDLFIEARVARHEAYTTIGPKYAGDQDPRFIDEQSGMGRTVSGNTSIIHRTHSPQNQYQASVNWYRNDWAGDHSFKFGAEYHDLEYDEEQIIPDTYTINRPYDRPDIWVLRNEVNWVDTGSILTLYAQDDWTWRDDWTFNLGLRWEKQEQKNDVGEQVYKFDSLLSPRLGVSWDVRGDGRSRLFAHYGRYHDAVGLYLATLLNRQVVNITRGEGDYENDDWEFVEPTWQPPNPNEADEGLDPNYKDEVVLGYEFEFLGDFAAGARIIANRQNTMIEDVLLNEDAIRRGEESEFIYLITNVEQARRDYRGLELSVKKQLSNNYEFLAVCTLSESKGSVAYGPQAEGLSEYADFEELKYNRYGNLPWDDEQYIKVNGAYHLPLGFIIGTSLNWRSGRPYNRIAIDLPEGAENFQGYTGQYFLYPRGSYRMGSAWWIDLRLRKDFEIGPTMLSLTADAFNLTNNQAVIGRTETEYYHGRANAWMQAGYFVLGGKLTF